MREVTLEEMLKRGVHFGHRESRWHPKMKPYIHTLRQGIHIINLERTLECLHTAYDFLKQQASEGKVILFVGTKRQAQKLIRDAAERVETPFITERWIGGTLTNFVTIVKLIRKLKQLRSARERGDLQKYTKKEQLGFTQEIEHLEHLIGGIERLDKTPDVIFVADTKQDSLAIEEARKLHIPRVAIVDTNANPELVDYPIPANDDAVSSLALIISLMAEAVEEGKKLFSQKPVDAGVIASTDDHKDKMHTASAKLDKIEKIPV